VSLSFRPLDENAAIEKTRRNLPHWRQTGCMYYVTFRLADSLPQTLLKQWQAERALWLKLNPRPWSVAVLREYAQRFQGPVEKWLDAGHGSCALRDPAKREVVAGALRHFDGERYALDAFVVMPNHVHALVVPKCDTARPGGEESDTVRPACADGGADETASAPALGADSHDHRAGRAGTQPGRAVSHSLSSIFHSWKSFTAHRLVKHHGMRAPVWMDENFDHVVRSEAQRMHFRNYIRENPAKANLREGEWTHWESEGDTAAEESDTARPACEQRGTVRPACEQGGTVRPACEQGGTVRPACEQRGTVRPACVDGGSQGQSPKSAIDRDSHDSPAGGTGTQPGRAVSLSAAFREHANP